MENSAEQTTEGQTWTRLDKEQINLLPMRRYEGTSRVVQTADELAVAVAELERETVLGFDTETRPAFRPGEHYPPSVLQLGGEKTVYLFMLKRLGLPPPLLGLLTNPEIIKAGVSLAYDLAELRKLTDFEPEGFVDLGDVAKKLGVQNHGLRGLAAALLGFRISKSSQTSNWDRGDLQPAQITYAATDAWVGRELYLELQALRTQA